MTESAVTVAGLRAAIDAGDESLPPILADALEDQGDPRAPWLRRIARNHRLRPAASTAGAGGAYWFLRTNLRLPRASYHLGVRLFNQLPLPQPPGYDGRNSAVQPYLRYPSASAALLALAEAFRKAILHAKESA